MKEVLVISYSQSGQSTRAAESLVSALPRDRFRVTFAPVRAREAYPFPWSFGRFFGILPECVLGRAPQIEPLGLSSGARFDLIVLATQVWFLAPSLPIQGFFRSKDAEILRDRRVITLVVCRNMWHTASETMKRLVSDAGGVLIDNVVVTDPSPPLASFVTTPRWMFTGRRDRFWKIFPPAGVPDETIRALSRFGKAIADDPGALEGPPGRSLLRGLGAVDVETRYVVPEVVGRFTFPFWARLIEAAGAPGGRLRGFVTSIFVLYLVFAILVLVPIAVVARMLLHPLLKGRLRSYVHRLRCPSGIDATDLEPSR